MTIQLVKDFGKKHYAGIILGFVTLLLIVAPYIVTQVKMGPAAQGYYSLATDGEVHILARMNNFIHRLSIGNPYIFEYRNEPSGFYSYAEGILALPSLVSGVSVATINFWYKFLLPLASFALLYVLFRRFEFSELLAAGATFFVMIASPILNLPQLIKFLTWHTDVTGYLFFARPVNPEFSAIFFFLFLNILYSWLIKPTKRKLLILGILFGTSIYLYLFNFLFLATCICVSTCVLILLKRYHSACEIALSGLLGGIIALPGLYHLFSLTQNPLYTLLGEHNSLLATRLPSISLIGLAALIVFLIVRYLYSRYFCVEKDIFFTILIISTFAVINQQIITGYTLQPGHFHWFFNIPIYSIVLLTSAHTFIRETKKIYQHLFLASVILVSFLFGTFIQLSSYRNNYNQTVMAQRLMAPLEWMRSHAPLDSVVFANSELSSLIPIYSGNYTAWDDSAKTYLIGHERLQYDTPEKILNNISNFQKTRKLDYILWDKQRDPEWKVENIPNITRSIEINNIAIYTIR